MRSLEACITLTYIDFVPSRHRSPWLSNKGLCWSLHYILGYPNSASNNCVEQGQITPSLAKIIVQTPLPKADDMFNPGLRPPSSWFSWKGYYIDNMYSLAWPCMVTHLQGLANSYYTPHKWEPNLCTNWSLWKRSKGLITKKSLCNSLCGLAPHIQRNNRILVCS